MVAFILAVSAVPFLAAAVATDISVRMVPNYVSAALALEGGALAILGHDLLASLLAMLCVLVPAVVCWRHGFLGGGDAKLLAAVTLLVPAHAVPSLVLTIAIAGGVLGLAYWTMTRVLASPSKPPGGPMLRRILRVEHYRIKRGFSLPYAVAISAGTIFTISRELAV